MTGPKDRNFKDRSRTYEIGYGKPPQSYQFKPRQSGNPRGRPKGAKNKTRAPNQERLQSIILEEAYRTIKVNDGNGQVSVPMAKAVIRSLAVNAAKGNQRSQRLFIELLLDTERQNRELHDEWLRTAIEYKVHWERELTRRQHLGITAPDPVPHPDDIFIDLWAGKAYVNGPMTKEEEVDRDWIRSRKAAIEKRVVEAQQMLDDNPEYEHREQIEDEINRSQRLLDLFRKFIPE